MARNNQPEFAVIGLGRFGSSLALTLAGRGYTVVGIDRDRALVQEFADELTQTVALDATDEDALRAIDIASFDTVVVAIGADFESNLMATVALKSLGVRHIVCKALSERQQAILLKVGADRVVLPEYEAAAFKLTKVGQISPITKTQFGYHIIRLEGVKPPQYVPFAEVKEFIKQQLMQEKQKEVLDKYIEDLKKGSKITINEALLKDQAAAKPDAKDVKPDAKDVKPDAKNTPGKPAVSAETPKKDTVPKSK